MADQITVTQGVADSIRCIAEYIARNADDYAVGMDDARLCNGDIHQKERTVEHDVFTR